MLGFIKIGESTYQMVEVEPREMDRLFQNGDSMEWPLRYDRRKRIYPPIHDGWQPFYYDRPKVM